MKYSKAYCFIHFIVVILPFTNSFSKERVDSTAMKQNNVQTNNNIIESIPCTNDVDCNDNDSCTVDKCNENQFCINEYDCKQCGLSKLVSVDIITDYPEETTWEIIDYKTNERIMANDKKTIRKDEHIQSKRQCLSEGGYIFSIYDSQDDIEGMYEIAVGDYRKLTGRYFKNTRTRFFLVKDHQSSSQNTIKEI